MKLDASRILPLAALFVLTTTAQAQGPGGGPGGFQIPPAMQAKFQAWQHWRDNHKNVSSLQRTLGALRGRPAFLPSPSVTASLMAVRSAAIPRC